MCLLILDRWLDWLAVTTCFLFSLFHSNFDSSWRSFLSLLTILLYMIFWLRLGCFGYLFWLVLTIINVNLCDDRLNSNHSASYDNVSLWRQRLLLIVWLFRIFNYAERSFSFSLFLAVSIFSKNLVYITFIVLLLNPICWVFLRIRSQCYLLACKMFSVCIFIFWVDFAWEWNLWVLWVDDQEMSFTNTN